MRIVRAGRDSTAREIGSKCGGRPAGVTPPEILIRRPSRVSPRGGTYSLCQWSQPIMTEAPPCPRCGCALPDDAPRGLCPACLIAAALAASEAIETHAREAETGADPDETTDPTGGRDDPAGGSAGTGMAPVTVRYF